MKTIFIFHRERGYDMKWISVQDRLPEDDTVVVVADIGHGQIYDLAACWYIHSNFSIHTGLKAENYDGGAVVDLDLTITHWCPLPPPESV